MTVTRPPTALQITERCRLHGWIAASTLQSVMAQEAAAVRMQLDQQALNAVPGDERVGLEVTEDTSPAAQRLKAHSSPGRRCRLSISSQGFSRFPRSVVRYRKCYEYGGVVIDTRTSLRTFETT
jgi:hypothetical protein